MRVLALAAILAGTTFALAGAAEAQSRRGITLDVKPRSWLDPGPAVPQHSQQNYVYDTMSFSDTGRFGSRGGDFGLLPDRFASGRGFAFESPVWWSVR
ncbi:hypothetical protein [Rhabdaerophilum calidifontis]|uniref:hypothetical protein n=1 Tax=Rhabdaerophilum calidifontis TaxID=2604328 RepID=UPI001238540D|nr:hypothetical protein [Rhabdaerophilum calidifontis]